MTHLLPIHADCHIRRATQRRTWTMRLSYLAAVIVIGVLALSRPSAAHTDLLSSVPAKGTTLAAPPRHVELEFTEPMAPSLATIMLTVPGGQPVELRVRSGPRDTVLLADVPRSATQEGTWRVGYRVTSVDGHPIQGKLDFEVVPSASPESAPSAEPSAAGPSARPGATTPSSESGTAERDPGTGWGWAGPALIAGAVVLLVMVVLRSRGTRSGGAGQTASLTTSSDRGDASDQRSDDGSQRNPADGPVS